MGKFTLLKENKGRIRVELLMLDSRKKNIKFRSLVQNFAGDDLWKSPIIASKNLNVLGFTVYQQIIIFL